VTVKRRKPNKENEDWGTIMKKTQCLVQTLALALAVAWSTSQARATSYTIGDGGLQSGWNLNADGSQIDGGNSLVGGIKLSLTSNPNNNFVTVCTDISGIVYLNSSYNYVSKTFSGQDGLNPNWGYGNSGTGTLSDAQKVVAAAAIQNAAYVFDLHKSVLTGTDNALKAAVQLAVWEALYDTGNPDGFSFTDASGRFEASNGASTAAGTAKSWLDAALGATGNHLSISHPLYEGYLLQPVLADGNTPDISVQEMLFNITPVPEPTTMIAGALLLLPFGASTLRFVRRNRTA
jgi:hypothetical protein